MESDALNKYTFEELLFDLPAKVGEREHYWNSDELARRNNEKPCHVTVRKVKEIKPFLN